MLFQKKNRLKKRGGSSKKPLDDSFFITFYFCDAGTTAATNAISLGANSLDACDMIIVQKIKIFVTAIASDSKRNDPFVGNALIELTVVTANDIVLFSDLDNTMQNKCSIWATI